MAKCYCGCGQAPGTTCRLRLIACNLCGVKARMSREALAAVVLSCSCGGTLIPACLEDRARAGDDAAWSELRFTLTRRDSPTAPAGAPRNVGARWWCASCSAFVRGESAECAKCRHRGPHHWGEDAPTTGNAARRARLRAKHRRQSRPVTFSTRKVQGDDLPF